MSTVVRLRRATTELRDRWRHRRDRLGCRDVVELVTDYLEGALDPRVASQFAHHLARCAECTRYLAQVELTRDAMGRVRPPDPPADARAALLDAFRDAQGNR
jgi:anti-sigma factor RsiW